MSATNGFHSETGGQNGNSLANGNMEDGVKMESGISNGKGHSDVKPKEEDLMNGLAEEMSVMDVDEEVDEKPSLPNGNAKISPIKSKLVQSVDDSVKMGVTVENGPQAHPVAPLIVPKCANGKLLCGLDGTSTYPCRRCHRVFYCGDEHRQQHFAEHQPDCKTVSSLEVIHYEEEYSMWLKYSAPHLYDVCLNFVLVWPSLTTQWLPDVIERENNILRHQLLIGTMTNQEQNHLLVCAIDIPDRSKTESGGEQAAKYEGTLYVVKRINHEAEVNRARYMPQDAGIVATKSSSPDVFIFDLSKHPEVPEDSTFSPLFRLKGHQKEGFGLSWNMRDAGKLLSGSDDKLVCEWDLYKTCQSDSTGAYLTALRTYQGHQDVVEDVDWHPDQKNIFASVGDDKRLILWDTRNTSGGLVHACTDAHQRDINAVSFSPFVETCLATGSSDSTVAIWDLRNLSKKLHSLEYHQAEVMQVQWSPHRSSILASTGKDNRVFVWDLAKASKPSDVAQSEEEAAPNELSFIHGGHIANVNDISWNTNDMGMIASVTEDNILQVWKISEELQVTYRGEDSDDDSVASASETFDD